ncbi:MAG TPA: hypothetical protein P5572_14085, partial [Phycisphaerae bacterium]|nr:hypothetical protein [Phycisphaerae bacterium]
MTLTQKFAVLVAVPVVGVVVLVGWAGWTMRSTSRAVDGMVNAQFLPLLDEQILPLLKNEMIPLIDEDVARLTRLNQSMQLMLEADRDMHQAVIAEKLCLVAKDKAFEEADQFNAENIEQAAKRVAKAADLFDTPEPKDLYTRYQAAFAQWKELTRAVITDAREESTLARAQASTNGGDAQTAFNDARGILDNIQNLQYGQIEKLMAQVNERRALINQNQAAVEKSRGAVVGEA